MHFANLVQAIDDLNCKRVCNVLFLDRRIHMDSIFLRQASMQTNAHLKNQVCAFSTNALTKVNQFRAMATTNQPDTSLFFNSPNTRFSYSSQ